MSQAARSTKFPSEERVSGVFRCAERATLAPATTLGNSEEIARAAGAISGSRCAVLLMATFGRRASASLADSSADPTLVTRLGAFLPRAGGARVVLDVPMYARVRLGGARVLVLPIATVDLYGWLAMPAAEVTPAAVRALETLASTAALELEAAERTRMLTHVQRAA